MIIPQQEAELLRKLLKGVDPAKFTSQQLSGKAHWRWDREQHLEAAVLFDAAANRTASEDESRKQQAFSYRIRAALNFTMAGEIERAWPVLEEATTFDWDAAGIGMDHHMTEWAFMAMMNVKADRDPPAVCGLFWHADARMRELGRRFPFIYYHWEQLLELCQKLGLWRELLHVISRIRAEGKPPRKLRKRIEELEKEAMVIEAQEPQPSGAAPRKRAKGSPIQANFSIKTGLTGVGVPPLGGFWLHTA